ncbi:MAG: hypothetical protein GX053_04815 [Tissierella sp.]|nr:hypothetical protein [Tissierella sp.]
MQDIKKHKIGMRTFKTALSVALSLFVADLLNLNSPSLVGIAAIVAMQSSVNESLIAGKNRMLATFVGAVVGLFFSYILPLNYFFLGLGIIAVIHIHNIFGWKQSLSLSAIVFLVIFLNQEGSRLLYATNRLLDTFIGIIVSTLINYFIATPDNKQSFIYIRDHIYNVIKSLVYDVITNPNQIDNDVFKEELDEYNHHFDALKSEMHMDDSSKKKSNKMAHDIVIILDKIENNILTILELNIIPILNEENISLFEQLYSEKYNSPDRENKDTDIIYNYHINKVFKKLLSIEDYWKAPKS